MKKISLICLLLAMSMLAVSKIHAQEVQMTVHPHNLLSLSNLVSDQTGQYGQTVQPIEVKSNTAYTFMIDMNYIGSGLDYREIEIEIISANGLSCANDVYFTKDEVRQLYFGMMNSYACNLIHFKKIPLSKTNNYNILLLEGTHDAFSGFEPYVSKNEILRYEGFLAVDYDHLYTTNDISQMIIAKTANGVVIPYQTVLDTYSSSNKLPGIYQMKFSVEHHKITKMLDLAIQVFDLSPPVMILPQNLEISLSQKQTLEQIKNLITVTDNVDQLNVQDIIVIADTYSSANVVGTYGITMEIKDSSGNTTTEVLSIQLVDKTGPVISGPKQIYVYTSDIVLTDADILEKYKAVDDVDGPNVSIKMSYNAYAQTKVAGIYDVILSATDSNQNVTYHEIKIHVIENRGPEFFMSSLILTMTTKSKMSEKEIIDWFKNQALTNGYEVSHVRVLLNEYENNSQNLGSYYIYMNYDLNQETYTSRVTIDVEEGRLPNIILPTAIGSMLVLIGVTVFLIIKKKK